MSSDFDAALAACDNEPIHLPGSIQPHGALLVLHPQGLQVLQASANCTAVLGRAAEPGRTLADLLGAATAQPLAAWLSAEDAPAQHRIDLAGRAIDLSVHTTPQGLLLELEPAAADEDQRLDALYPRVQRYLDATEGEMDLGVLGHRAAREVRRLTGFNRVLVYRFDEEWHGTVIAEDGDGVLPSYLDLRFPASDIPAQARELYRRQRLRLIPDANYTRSRCCRPPARWTARRSTCRAWRCAASRRCTWPTCATWARRRRCRSRSSSMAGCGA